MQMTQEAAPCPPLATIAFPQTQEALQVLLLLGLMPPCAPFQCATLVPPLLPLPAQDNKLQVFSSPVC